MKVLFIRHATAESGAAKTDADRELTDEGLKEARTLAKAIKALGLEVEAILTSPLTRAVQTAGALHESFPKARLEETQVLVPWQDAEAGPMSRLLKRLLKDNVQCAALVGHAPSIDEHLGLLVARTPATGFSLPKAGAACIQMPEESSPTGVELRWLMRPDQLKLLAKAGKGKS